ncbi:MAG: PKD domain-containing protein [Planctomycetes bacterium]|nr:PKD domain-containing protein [Planctomycetota bacterium]
MISVPRFLLVALCATAAPSLAQSPIYSGVIPPATAFQGSTVISTTTISPATHMFDVMVTDPNGITITQFDQRLSVYGTLPGTYSIYVTQVGGTAVGNETNGSAWTLMASETVNQNNAIVSIPLSTPFFLAQGSYGMAIFYDGLWPYYSNPATTGVPTTYVATEVTLDMTSTRIRRSSSIDPFDPLTGTGFSPRHPQIAMHFVSGAVSVNFEGTPTEGTTPLPVQFTDYSISGNAGGIAAWIWDFDSDGTVDSTAQNPLHTYTQCGDYSVTLTIIDSAGPHSITKTNYVQTDLLAPAFSSTTTGATGTVQFTDLTTPTPASWAWDLDGDGTTDSTLQNPTFTYANPGCTTVDVTLTVQLACRAPVSLTRPTAMIHALDTVFNGGTFIATTSLGGSNFIDVTVTNPDGVTICGLLVKNQIAGGQQLGVDLWQKSGTYVGAETTPDVWRHVASETVTAAPTGSMTYAGLSTPLYLAPGTHGLIIQQTGHSPRYSNLGGTQTFSNGDLSISAGMTMADPLFSGTVYNPRIWNGTLLYRTSAADGAPGYGYIGAGCPGSLGVPGNVAQSQPIVGTTMNIDFDNLASSAAILALGFSRTNSPLGPLPINLTPYGAPGCMARVSTDATLLILGAGNIATFGFSLPNAPSLVGVKFYSQALAIDVGFNALNGVMSDAAAMIIGQ